MKYQPITCVWEVTMGCNMRCGHCGSSCKEPLPDELKTEEALDLCDQIGELGLKWITLSGGEPLTRKDIPRIIKRLNENGVIVNLITNGWLLSETMVIRLKESGVATVAISIDGTEEIHDKIRKEGSFARSKRAFALLNLVGIETGAVTTITKQNIGHLHELKEELIAMGVQTWQVQLGLPMGNLKEQEDWVLEPEQMNDIIDFCFETAQEGRIRIFPADCIGYYTHKELTVKKISYRSSTVPLWDGCNAGLRGFGILHNGNILGCTSIRSEEYLEGNIRERSLRDIWEDENAFFWRRKMTAASLTDDCAICNYKNKCLGGCANTRLTMNGSMDSENRYCAYNVALKNLRVKYQSLDDITLLMAIAEKLIGSQEHQEAAFALARVLELQPEHSQALMAKGYCDYMCSNYSSCKEANEAALALNAKNPYAMRGLAVALHKLGDSETGIRILQEAVALNQYQDQDLLHDLSVLRQESSLTEAH